MLITGNVREGKTLFMVHRVGLYRAKGGELPVYTNFKLDLSITNRVGVSELLDLEGLKGGVMCMDEAYAWLESRVSTSNLNRYVSYFIFQSGKREVDVMATAQLGSSVDLRFFDLAHQIVLARKDVQNERFVYKIATRCGVGVRVATKYLCFKSASRFWHVYDTGEPVAPLGLKRLQFEMDKFDKEKINKRVDGLVKLLLWRNKTLKFGWNKAGDIARYVVEDELLRLGEPLPLAPLVTNRLKRSFKIK